MPLLTVIFIVIPRDPPNYLFFFFNDPATPEIYPLSLPAPLPIPIPAFARTPATVATATLAASPLRVITTSPNGRGAWWLATPTAKGSCSSTPTCYCSPASCRG